MKYISDVHEYTKRRNASKPLKSLLWNAFIEKIRKNMSTLYKLILTMVIIIGIAGDFIFFYLAFLCIASFLKWICSSSKIREIIPISIFIKSNRIGGNNSVGMQTLELLRKNLFELLRSEFGVRHEWN